MTTKARIAALQWFHDRGETPVLPDMPSKRMVDLMFFDGQLSWRRVRGLGRGIYTLTDKGRQDLHEATK